MSIDIKLRPNNLHSEKTNEMNEKSPCHHYELSSAYKLLGFLSLDISKRDGKKAQLSNRQTRTYFIGNAQSNALEELLIWRTRIQHGRTQQTHARNIMMWYLK